MGYDYDRTYLERHWELALKLKEIFEEGKIWSLGFRNPKDLASYRHRINNTLACFALYGEEIGQQVKAAIQTWTQFHPDEGLWYLHVGHPPIATRGGRRRIVPRHGVTPDVSLERFGYRVMDNSQSAYTIEVTDQSSYMKLIAMLLKPDKAPGVIKATFPGGVSADPFIQALPEDSPWQINKPDDETLTFTRST